MSTYRTLRERPELYFSRTPRSRREAGIVGPLDTRIPSAEYVSLLRTRLDQPAPLPEQDDDDAPFGVVGMLIGAFFAGLALWAFFLLVLGA